MARRAIEPIKLSPNWADALRRVHLKGPTAWASGKGRAGGAVSRMFDRMREAGLVTGPPYALTALGRVSLGAHDVARTKPVSLAALNKAMAEVAFEKWLDKVWPLWRLPKNRGSIHYHDHRRAFLAGWNARTE